jgi:hypothetical protein
MCLSRCTLMLYILGFLGLLSPGFIISNIYFIATKNSDLQVAGNLNIGVILGLIGYIMLLISLIYQCECCGEQPVLLLTYLFFLFTLVYNVNLLVMANPDLINNLRVYHADSYNFYIIFFVSLFITNGLLTMYYFMTCKEKRDEANTYSELA